MRELAANELRQIALFAEVSDNCLSALLDSARVQCLAPRHIAVRRGSQLRRRPAKSWSPGKEGSRGGCEQAKVTLKRRKGIRISVLLPAPLGPMMPLEHSNLADQS